MKKFVGAILVLLLFVMLAQSTKIASAVTIVEKPDLPSDFWNSATWPETHSDVCAPNCQEYQSIAYARILDGNKRESVLATMVSDTIITYEHVRVGAVPDFGYRYIRSNEQWLKFDLMNYDDYLAHQIAFKEKLLEYGIHPEEREVACKELFEGFKKFWDDLDTKAGIE
ncbi:MAG: hypothetical protein Q7R73_04585 [bacterium]|nr:hypothetical protein [bacterium]